MSRLAQAVQQQVRELRSTTEGATEGRRGSAPIGGAEAADVTDELLANDQPAAGPTMKGRRPTAKKRDRTKKATAAPKARRQKPTTDKAKDPTAGVRDNPKSKILFLNRPGAQALVSRLVHAAAESGELTPAEQFEADRLIARLDARA